LEPHPSPLERERDPNPNAPVRLPLLDFRLKLTHLVHAAAYGAKRCFIQKNGTDVACLVPPHEGQVLRALGRFVDLELLAQMLDVEDLDAVGLADSLASCLTLRGKTGPVHFGPGLRCAARPLEAPPEEMPVESADEPVEVEPA